MSVGEQCLRSVALAAASLLLFGNSAAAQAPRTAGAPAAVAPRISAWETGVWTTYDPGCFGPYYSCYSSQEAYNEGEIPKHPLPLKPEYAAEFKRIQDALKDGVSLFDPDALCHPSGVPYMIRSPFKMAVQTDRIYFLYGGSQQIRTIYMDGRAFPELDPAQYTYNGYSVGRWEANTLVVETRNIRGPDTAIGPHVPKSDNFWVTERYTPVSDAAFDFQITMMDEDRWTGPLTQTYQVRRNADADLAPQTACISGAGQRYQPDPDTGELLLTGPGGQALEKAED